MKFDSLSKVMCGVALLLYISCTTALESESTTYDIISTESTVYETTDISVGSTFDVSTAADILSSTEAPGTTSELSNETWWIVGAVLAAILIIYLVYLIYKIKNRKGYKVQQIPKRTSA